MEIAFNQFANCCGVNEIGSFGNDDDIDNGNFTKDDLFEEIEAHTNDNNYVVATTIEDQSTAIAGLKKNGFEPIAKFRNGINGNVVTMWGKAMYKVRGGLGQGTTPKRMNAAQKLKAIKEIID